LNETKKSHKQRRNFKLLTEVMEKLINECPLESKYCDHPLKGEWKGFRDCHIENDWVLIYKVEKAEKRIIFARLGTHAELFN
jgi:mRNA interferase YafQ